jgi:hypothetical protein
MYAALTWFQAAMYFSMHDVMHVCSLLEREVPGLGTHFSKQFSWSFYIDRISWSASWFCGNISQMPGVWLEDVVVGCIIGR